jgi:hypothetical protein
LSVRLLGLNYQIKSVKRRLLIEFFCLYYYSPKICLRLTGERPVFLSIMPKIVHKLTTYLYRTAYTHSLKSELPLEGSCFVQTKGESKSLQRALLQQGFKWAGMKSYYDPLTPNNQYFICWKNHLLYPKEFSITWTVSSNAVSNTIVFSDYFKPLKKFRGLNMKRFGV